MVVLTPKDKQVLYQRYHALKSQAKKKRVSFYWDDSGVGSKGFFEDVAATAPLDYTPETYTIRFDRKVVELNGYGPQAMRFKPFSKQASERKQKRKIDRLQLAGIQECRILSLATANLCLSLLEEEGDIDVLVENAFLSATTGD